VRAAVLRRLQAGAVVAEARTWQRVGDDVLAQLRVIDLAADGLAGDCLLFTLVGVVVTAELVAVFGLGDGVYGIDGEVRQLGPFADNAPPYLGHALVGGPATPLQLHALRAADTVDEVVIGTDGATAVDVAGLAADPLIWRNPDGLRRRLAVLAAERGGPVADDVALAILRRHR
jgi:hypothetical protein